MTAHEWRRKRNRRVKVGVLLAIFIIMGLWGYSLGGGEGMLKALGLALLMVAFSRLGRRSAFEPD